MRQLLEDNLFHGDMHPGNIILLRHNRYALIDFGTIGSLHPVFLQTYLAVLRALNDRKYGKAAALSLFLCSELPTFDIDIMKNELISAFKLWQARSELDSLSYHERSFAASSKIIGQVFQKYNLQISWAVLRMARTLATLDTSLAYFYPEMKHTKMFSLYLKDAKRRHQKYRLENLRESLFQTLETANQYRIILEPILHRAAITYQQKVNKLSLVAATMMRFSYYSIILLIGFIAHVYLHQNFPSISDYPGAAIVKLFPIIQNESFVLIVIVLVMVCVLLRRLIKIVSASYLR
jgi:ubiquinone biosynthesis protein